MPPGDGGFMGARTVRFGSLIAGCEEARSMAMNPLLLHLVESVLGPYCMRVQLNYTGVMHLLPGEKAQVVHRDANLYPFQNPAPPLICASMWAVNDFTAENGATWLVPGSHLWDDDRLPTEDDVVQAIMPAGSMLLYIGSVFHGGGANQSNGPRTGCALQYALGWLRQEENQYMACPPEIARDFAKPLQELLGYDLGGINLGMVSHQHPNDVLNGTTGDGPGELEPPAFAERDPSIHRFKVSDTRPVIRRRVSLDADKIQGRN